MIPADPARWGRCLDGFRDPEVKQQLVRLFVTVGDRAREAVSDGHEILIVLVSRRLSCLYEMVLAAGYEDLRGLEVVSDRALEGGVRPERGQRVLLVDDVLVLGSTLVDLFDRIETMVGDRGLIEVMVACMDADRSSEALRKHLRIPTAPGEAPLLLSTEVLERAARDIACSLFRAGRPYFTDFPLVKRLDLPAAAIEALTATQRWFVADVTPPAAYGGDRRKAYTFIPRDKVDGTIRAGGSREAMRLIEGLKVRMYVGEEEAGSREVRLVPMGLPGAMMVPRLDRILSAISRELGGERLDWSTWDPEARHRLLQMYASSCVLAEFWNDLRSVGVERPLDSDVLEDAHLQTYFGRDDFPVVRAAFDRTVERYRASAPERRLFQRPAARRSPPQDPALVPEPGLGGGDEADVRKWIRQSSMMVEATAQRTAPLDVLSRSVPPPEPPPGAVRTVDQIWVHRTLSVFGLIDDLLERPQEKRLKDYTYAEYKAYASADGDDELGPRVIKHGMAMVWLMRLLFADVPLRTTWERAWVSLAIDVGNDLGVVVPSTVCRNGMVWRQYRSGEMAFAARSPHYRGLARGGAEPILDDFTVAVIEDVDRRRGGHDARSQLIAETFDVLKASSADATVRQVWIGEVTATNGTRFEASVHSLLHAGESTVASLPLADVEPGSGRILSVSSEIEWTVFDADDERSPHPSHRIRLVGAPSAR